MVPDRSRRLGVVAATAVVILLAGLGIRGAATSDPSLPPTATATLASPTVVSEIGTTFSPPPPDADPAVDSAAAINRAWEAEPRPDADSVTAELVVMESDQLATTAPTLVWLVTYNGTCVRAHGPVEFDYHGECVGTEQNVLIDATTGEFISTFAISHLPADSTSSPG